MLMVKSNMNLSVENAVMDLIKATHEISELYQAGRIAGISPKDNVPLTELLTKRALLMKACEAVQKETRKLIK